MEIVLGVKTLAGSNPASSANYPRKHWLSSWAMIVFRRLGLSCVSQLR